MGRRQQGDDARVHPAAEVGSDRHVAAQLEPNRVVEQSPHFDDEVLLGVVGIDGELRLPEALGVAVRPDAQVDELPVPRLQLVHAGEQRVVTGHELEREVVADRVEVGLRASPPGCRSSALISDANRRWRSDWRGSRAA